ncbi:MAG: hypothetical protein EOO36_08420 [Cytophagaceae bacterium]|nr:MAG: hypothetical protein EOO36_08420 [Cytophagaceae bacterium]
MAPILVEPLSEKAYELLQQLEALHVLRLVEVQALPAAVKKHSIASLIGTLSPEAGARLQSEVVEMRNEWDRE